MNGGPESKTAGITNASFLLNSYPRVNQKLPEDISVAALEIKFSRTMLC